MRFFLALLVWGSINSTLFSQENYYSVVAEQGDGIFSMLRKQGLDPVKYYESFINLNQENIKDGSLLHVGREYKIPKAEDSYKNKGMKISASDASEKPIFDKELGSMSHKSHRLKDAVYYLIAEDSASAPNPFVADIAKNLAASLLEQGATVYVMGNEEQKLEAKNSGSGQTALLGEYVDAINKKYLQNQGKYQRLLVIRANGVIKAGNLDVSVYHHDKSEQGQRLAENLQNVFKENSVVKKKVQNSKTFDDKYTLYLAKNTLPAVSLITVNKRDSKNTQDAIPVRSDKKEFANWITNGILKDYADLQIEH
nr:N-acetylmuramoyl-L-alanine amidase [Allomuricauda sp.]